MCELPVADGGVVRDDIGTAGGGEPPRCIGEHRGVGHNRERRAGRDAVACVPLGNRPAAGDNAVVAGRGRDRDEPELALGGSHLRDVDRLAAANPDEVVRVDRVQPVENPLDGTERRLLDDDQFGGRPEFTELLDNGIAGDPPGGRARDDQRLAREVCLGDRLTGPREHTVADHDVPREPYPRRLLEHISSWWARAYKFTRHARPT